ncbi:glycosyltransferase [Enterococcus faecalis]|uniref:glycosyltransferase n=1 Tax=Enterococcus faecalis TaxID=1351 RepID=UPI00287FA120|nr:glycosyltransferase [Enterococcus faecalis]
MKYDFEMETDESTSVGKIVAQIKENSDVLEFGPGNGRMTSYLMEEKKCQVSIVELDKELYDHVSQFSTDAFYGNIDENDWVEYFAGKTFDYIVFADVLEHLMNPQSALAKVKPFLKPGGQILITFPNLAHNSVLIDLFNNRLTWNETGLLDATHKSFYLQEGFEKVFAEVGLYIAKEDFTFNQVGYNEIPTTYEALPVEVQAAFKARPFGEVYQYFFALTAEPVEQPERVTPVNSYNEKNVHILINCGEEKETELDQPVDLQKPETKRFQLKIPEDVQLIKLFPSLTGTIIKLSMTIDGETVPVAATNAFLVQENIYYFLDTQVPVIEVTDAQMAGKDLTVDIDYFFEGNYSERENTFIHALLDERNQFLEEMNKQTETAPMPTGKYKRITLTKFDKMINLTIDDIARDVENNVSVIRGWAYDKQTNYPLRFSIAEASESVTYTVETEYRRDVIDMFELEGDQDYGFVITIKDPEDLPAYTLNIDTKSGQKVQYVVERPNVVQPGTKFDRAWRSIQTRGLMGSVKWYFKRQEKAEAPVDVEAVLAEIKTFQFQPKISVAVPVYNVEEKWLAACVSSLQNQYYENWELCLADDASPSEHIKPMLEKYKELDQRIKVIYREENGHISEATNSALSIATGDFVGFMDNDDELAPQALYEVVKALNTDPTIDFLYTDEDKITENGRRFNAFYKSDWNPELILNHNYITHFVVVKRDLLEKVGGLNSAYNGAQDYDFVLRATEQATKIKHIPGMMYHWRAIESSTALNPESKGYAYVAGQKAVQAATERRGLKAQVEIAEFYGSYKINYLYDHVPMVSLIITNDTENMSSYLRQLLEKTAYTNYEILLPARFENQINIQNDRLRYVSTETRHGMIQAAKGEYVALLNAGLVPTKNDWLKELMNIGQQETSGLVTGRVVDARYRVETVGVSVDTDKGRLLYPEKGTPGKSLGYYYRIALPRNIQAATEDCLLFNKQLYLNLEGINENLGKEWMGVDLSLQFASAGKRNVYVSYAILKADEKMQNHDKKGSYKELAEKWTAEALVDPYRNPKHL